MMNCDLSTIIADAFKIFKIPLDILFCLFYNSFVVWVWRSLVARVNGVHEAGGSIPLTQTIFFNQVILL